jgi:hypothetical protein
MSAQFGTGLLGVVSEKNPAEGGNRFAGTRVFEDVHFRRIREPT